MMTMTFNPADLDDCVSALTTIRAFYPDLVSLEDDGQKPAPAPTKKKASKKKPEATNEPPPHTDADVPADVKPPVKEKPAKVPQEAAPIEDASVVRTVAEVQELAKNYLVGLPADQRPEAKAEFIDILKKNFSVSSTAALDAGDMNTAYDLLEDWINKGQ